MRTPTALLALAVLLLGCPKKEEAQSPSARHAATAPDGGGVAAVTPVTPDADAGPAVASPDGGPAETESELACVDHWLKDHKLDDYGNAEGTMYTGGTPLFDERTGESRDRLAFVYERQPEAKQACKAGGP